MNKFRLLHVFAVLLAFMHLHGQDNFRVSRVSMNANGSKYIDQVEYYDGLGRLMQVNARGQSSDGGDIVFMQEYDSNGRKSVLWQSVPFSSGAGCVPAHDFRTASEQYYGDHYGYTLTEYEPSQDEIETSITRPGDIYHTQGLTLTTERVVNNNTAMLKCAKYTIETSGKLKHNGIYSTGSFQGTKTIDEDGHIVIEFKNALDKPVLQRSILSEGNYADTYYVYDDYDRLRYVIPPMASKELTATGDSWDTSDDIVYQYCYYYEYDIIGNITQKKLPGCDKIIYYYNTAHRLVLSRDGNQCATQYTYTIYLYDKYGREAIRGAIDLLDSEVSLYTESDIVAENTGNGSEETYGYTFNIGELPIYISTVEIVTYYDDYSFLDKEWFGDTTDYRYREHTEGDSRHANSTGRMTGQYIRNSGLTSYYYDTHGNVVQSHSRISGLHSEYTRYSYTHKPLSRFIIHKKSSDSIAERYRYSYDHADRLQSVHHRLNDNEEVLLTSNSYNRLGLLNTQNTGGISTAAYTYDIEGRAKKITSPHFTQELYYHDSSSPCYNGNISRIDWVNDNGLSHSYCYSYDNMNRLTQAQYISEKSGVDFSATYSYDANGNPTSITRSGITEKNGSLFSYGTIDQMNLSYNGNQLKKIDDAGVDLSYVGAMDFSDGSTAASEYTWDKNGNMTRDLNRKISQIQYNSLNLPETITFTDGHKVMNTYDSNGRKVRVSYQVAVPSVTTPQADGVGVTSSYYRTYMQRTYSGNCIYRNDTLERILTTTGYITPDGTYHHYLKDYQGNNRMVLNQSGQTIERTNYYPYGMTFADGDQQQPYKYSGKELETMNGQRHLDYGARWMDFAVGRFTTIDSYCEKYYNLSPYAYCAGNPIMFIDPTGMEIWINDIMYSIGMSYDGNNEFIKNTIMALNTIADNGGNKLISDLIDSSKKYDYLLTSNSNSHTVQLENGDVEIRISSSNITDQNSFFSAVAHESMHGVQYENGQGGASIFNEVEAYVFEATIATNSQLDNHPNKFHVNIPASEEGVSTVYEKAFSQLLWNGYAPKSMMDAVTHFKTEASANNTGLYNKYRLYINAPFDSMLRKYLNIQ